MLNKTLIATIIMLFVSSLSFAGVDFDGTDDFVTSGDTTSFDGATELSMTAWINMDDVTTQGAIVSKWDDNNSTDDSFLMSIIGGNVRCAAQAAPSPRQFSVVDSNTTTLSTGTDYFIACVWNGVYDWNIYINGLLQAESIIVNSGANASIASTAAELVIGGAFDSPGIVNPADGDINNVAVWDSALSQSDIDILYDSKIKRIPLQINSANLLYFIPLDDEPDGTSADGDTFLDMSGSGNNGTGDDGANNTGLTANAEEVLTY